MFSFFSLTLNGGSESKAADCDARHVVLPAAMLKSGVPTQAAEVNQVCTVYVGAALTLTLLETMTEASSATDSSSEARSMADEEEVCNFEQKDIRAING